MARQGHSCAHWLSRGSCGCRVARFDGGHRGDVSAAGVRIQIVQTLLQDAVDWCDAELLAAKLALFPVRCPI